VLWVLIEGFLGLKYVDRSTCKFMVKNFTLSIISTIGYANM